MSEPGARTEGPTGKEAMQIARERLGGVPEKARNLSRAQAKIHRKIRAALGKGPMTVPAIGEATGLAADEVFWHLMAMKKYGDIVEGEERDSYYEYALKQEEGEQK